MGPALLRQGSSAGISKHSMVEWWMRVAEQDAQCRPPVDYSPLLRNWPVILLDLLHEPSIPHFLRRAF